VSAIDETPVKDVAGKDTRGAAAGGVHPAPALTDQVLAQLRNRGLVPPRAPRPGQPWRPRTEAETHLLAEARHLDRARQLLLAEVGRLRHMLGVRRTDGQERREADARAAVRWSGCPLGVTQMSVLIGAARGERSEETAARLHIADGTVKSTRVRVLRRLEARTITHAVAIAVTAGWITGEDIGGGGTG
jgi:DNA-binding CsgD family transcriptional regulator